MLLAQFCQIPHLSIFPDTISAFINMAENLKAVGTPTNSNLASSNQTSLLPQTAFKIYSHIYLPILKSHGV
jgi:hypothetical protein